MPRPLTVKVLKIKNKEKILNAARGKRAIIFYISKSNREIETMGYIEREKDIRWVLL